MTPESFRQLGLLVICQALLFANAVAFNTINGLVGLRLAPSPVLATLPIALYVIGATVSTMPASLYMRRAGRRKGLTEGALFGAAGTLCAAAGAYLSNFTLLCIGTSMVGIYNASGQYYRFTALEVAEVHSPRLKERAVALVLSGGIAGGIIGPALAKFSRDIGSEPFAMTYVALTALCFAAALILQFLREPKLPTSVAHASGRTLREIARTPGFMAAASSAALGYAIMN